MNPIAEACTVAEMLEAYRARMAMLQVTMGEVGRVSTLADGYTSKLLAANPVKSLGPFSFHALNTTLGVKWVMVEDAATLKHAKKLKRAASPAMLNIGKIPIANPLSMSEGHIVNSEFFRLIGTLGGLARSAKLSRSERRTIARRGAAKRWQKRAS